MKVYYQVNSDGKGWLYIFCAAFLVSFLFLPLLVFAAKGDALLQSGTEITANGITVTVKESGVESITVNSGNFVVTLPIGAGILITSSDRRSFTVSPMNRIESFDCQPSASVLFITGPPNGSAVDVTITPESTTCSSGGGGIVSGGVSSPGGGAGPSVTVAPAITPAVVVAAPSSELSQIIELFIALGIIPADKVEKARNALAAQAPQVSTAFAKGLGRGSSNSDIKRLQQLLNSDPDTQISSSGVGSSGKETEFFGSLTEKAVQKFQVKHGVAGPGSAGYGYVGPKTRAKLNEVFGSGSVPAASVAQPSAVAQSVSPVFNKGLSRGSSNSDIKRLQQLLNSDPDTQISSSGVGSAGNETEFFGSLTEKAVQKFQVKHGVAGLGEPGYGYVGPKTRAKLNEIFGN